MDIKIDISKLHNNLLQYQILNNINFYLFLFEDKNTFLKVAIKVKVIDVIKHNSEYKNI